MLETGVPDRLRTTPLIVPMPPRNLSYAVDRGSGVTDRVVGWLGTMVGDVAGLGVAVCEMCAAGDFAVHEAPTNRMIAPTRRQTPIRSNVGHSRSQGHDLSAMPGFLNYAPGGTE